MGALYRGNVTEPGPRGRGRCRHRCVWSGPRFVSVILFTCAEFDETRATELTRVFSG